MEKEPSISVLMAVHNGASFLEGSIESILAQSFRDFEFLIINDGSTDETEAIIRPYTGDRVIYIKNETNTGLTASLNKGIALARGTYIARMDADDIALPQRLEKQFEFMEAHPSVAVCGTQAYGMDVNGTLTGAKEEVPVSSEAIKAQLLFQNAFIHPSTFFRATVLKKYQYDITYPYAQDFELFARIAGENTVANLDEFLLWYRRHTNNITYTRNSEVSVTRRRVFAWQLENLLGDIGDHLLNVHISLCDEDARFDLGEYKHLMERLKAANKKRGTYDKTIFNKLLYDRFYKLVREKGGKQCLGVFFGSSLFEFSFLTFKQVRKLLKQSIGIH